MYFIFYTITQGSIFKQFNVKTKRSEGVRLAGKQYSLIFK